MKQINNSLLLATLLGTLLLSSATHAQKVTTTQPTVKKIGNQVEVSFNATVTALPTNYSLLLTPTLSSETNEQALTPIVAQGRNKRIMQQRSQTAQTAVVAATLNKTITYSCTIPFKTWMAGASLRLNKTLKGCCGNESLPPTALASNLLKPTRLPVAPLFQHDIKAAHTSNFKQTIQAYPFVHIGSNVNEPQANSSLAVSFEQAVSTIDSTHADNRTFLIQIKKALETIKANPNIELTKITIMGGASPEGTFIDNQKLGQRRAETLINYLSQGINANLFDVENIGENWSGLYRMVAQSDMEHKAAVLSIIDNVGIHQGREKKLMDLKHGAPYKYMLKEFFPALRKASYIQVFCNVKPNNDFAKIDQAALLIEHKNYNKALTLLKDITPSPEVNNLIGVCYMMLENTAKARLYLKRAIEGENKEAKTNLDKLDYQSDNIQYN